MRPMSPTFMALGVVAAALGWPLSSAQAADPAAGQAPAALQPCRLKGVEHGVLCGSVKRPLDPAAPAGAQIDVHFAVLPALARHKHPDPVFFFAGGPGQSAIALAGALARPLARLTNRRDLVLIDQRGTGRSAPLACPPLPATAPLRDRADPAAQLARLRECRAALEKLPHGDLRHYTTEIASADVHAVQQALGVAQVNLVGASYGTRAALDYLRQFPQAVRRTVIDGVAPPDMALPASVSTDTQAAFDALLADCARDSACAAHHPGLAAQWAALLKGLPREVTVPHPMTGREERFTLTREGLTGLVRPVLYAPLLASALPHALAEAAQGRFTALVGLSGALGGGDSAQRLAEGMHFSVVCAEDLPRMPGAEAGGASSAQARDPGAAVGDGLGADFGDDFAALYRKACEGWPRGAVSAAFQRMPPAATPVLLLSGGLDPVTPPRHGERAARALGAQARHVVVPKAGHGVMLQGCLRDVVFRFIDAEAGQDALKVEADCAARLPRPPAFMPPGAAAPAAVSTTPSTTAKGPAR